MQRQLLSFLLPCLPLPPKRRRSACQCIHLATPLHRAAYRSVVTSCASVACALASCDARPPTATHTPSCGLYPATAGTSASWSRANHTSPLALRLTTGTGAAHHRRERWRRGGGAGRAGLVLPGACAARAVGCRVWVSRDCSVAGAASWRVRLHQAQLYILLHVITSASPSDVQAAVNAFALKDVATTMQVHFVPLL